jgi:glucose-1-phosphate thymidylyltransferase
MSAYQRVLFNGEKWGLSFSYAVQPIPRGLADAFIVGQKFIDNQPVCLILGDNIFHGNDLSSILKDCSTLNYGSIIFAYQVKDPERYGVVEFDENNRVLSLEEKPAKPKSNYSVPGIYFYDKYVCDYANNLKPSKRGELEILDLARVYLNKNQLLVKKLSRGTAWLDGGLVESLLQAGNYIQTVEERQGLMIACPEEIAYQMNFITAEQVYNQAIKMADNSYKKYLLNLIGKEYG